MNAAPYVLLRSAADAALITSRMDGLVWSGDVSLSFPRIWFYHRQDMKIMPSSARSLATFSRHVKETDYVPVNSPAHFLTAARAFRARQPNAGQGQPSPGGDNA